MTNLDLHAFFMREALAEARLAAQAGEIPVGAVVVLDGGIVARAHNLVENRRQGFAHAELLALEEASRALGMWRLDGCSLYVTKEPCAMCAGAMVNCRLPRLYFGCGDAKTGAAGGAVNVTAMPLGFHEVAVTGGILGEECLELLQEFFRRRRAAAK